MHKEPPTDYQKTKNNRLPHAPTHAEVMEASLPCPHYELLNLDPTNMNIY